MVLSELPPTLANKTGIYCLSLKSPNTHHTKVVKIGKAENFKNRLDSYHTYYADGFYMYTFLTCKNSESTAQVERYMLKLCRTRGYYHKAYQNRLLGRLTTLSETFDMTNREILDVFNLTYEHFQKSGEVTRMIEWMIHDKSCLINNLSYVFTYPKTRPKPTTKIDKALYNRPQWIPVYNTGYGKPLYKEPLRKT